MTQDRRGFLKSTALATGAAVMMNDPYKVLANSIPENVQSGILKLTYRPYTLELKHIFTIATNSRTTTPVVLTEIEFNGVVGYGEASLPPYLGESQESVQAFLSKVDLQKYENPFDLETILNDIDGIEQGNLAAKASVDIALHDLVGKLMGQPWYNIWGYDRNKTPYTSFHDWYRYTGCSETEDKGGRRIQNIKSKTWPR